jgi:hypothetical protein
MTKTSHRKLIVLGLLAAAVPAALLANHSWGGYHWARTSNPFTLKVIDSVTSVWDSYLDTAESDWNSSSKLNTQELAGDSSSRTARKCSAPTGQVRVCNLTYGNNGWLGIAGISIDSNSHITKGYVKLNDTYFNTSTYNTPAWRRLVSCQELGHTIGLDHQDETFDNVNLGTCMDYTNDPDGGAGGVSSNDPSNEYPNSHDYQELDTIYGHTDGYTTLTASLPMSAGEKIVDQLDTNHPAAWGRLVSRSRDGGQETYLLDLGGGNKQFTFVTWTLDEAAKRRAPQSQN